MMDPAAALGDHEWHGLWALIMGNGTDNGQWHWLWYELWYWYGTWYWSVIMAYGTDYDAEYGTGRVLSMSMILVGDTKHDHDTDHEWHGSWNWFMIWSWYWVMVLVHDLIMILKWSMSMTLMWLVYEPRLQKLTSNQETESWPFEKQKLLLKIAARNDIELEIHLKLHQWQTHLFQCKQYSVQYHHTILTSRPIWPLSCTKCRHNAKNSKLR